MQSFELTPISQQSAKYRTIDCIEIYLEELNDHTDNHFS